MSKLQLKKITLVAVSSIKIDKTIFALSKSMERIDYHDVVLISHEKPKSLPVGISFKKCSQLRSIKDYNKFIIYDLSGYIESDFALVVQYDGYVLNSEKWEDSFLDYDYIGAPWHKGLYFTDSGKQVRVGNGGFSLRSKKLLSIFDNLNLSLIGDDINNYNEDGIICIYFREELEKNGIKFSPVSIASKFSREENLLDSEKETFGFHTYKTSFKIRIKKNIKIFFSLLNINIRKKLKKSSA